MSSTNIIIATDDHKTINFNNYLSRDKGYNIIIGQNNIEFYNTLTLRYKKAVVILSLYETNKEFCISVIEKIKGSNYKMILICENIKEGFFYLDRGIDEIVTRAKSLSLADKKAFITVLEMKIDKLVREYDKDKRVVKNRFLTPINKIIAIGSSTGGTECVEKILRMLPENTSPILIVQHMPPVFTELYSQRLNNICKMTVLEAQDGDELENGKVLIAPGGKQMRLEFRNNRYSVSCRKEGHIGGHEPAVDELFTSVAKKARDKAIGVILTGMGKDGAEGLLKMKMAGAYTIGQDEQSSIVYGMPKAAYDIGAVKDQANPVKIVSLLIKHM